MPSTLAKLGLLSLASMALAHPHQRQYEGEVPYPAGNSTSVYPTGTGAEPTYSHPHTTRSHKHGHGHGQGQGPQTSQEVTTTYDITVTTYKTVTLPNPTEPAGTPSDVAAEEVESTCGPGSTVTETVTDRVTVTVAPPETSSEAPPPEYPPQEPAEPPAPAPETEEPAPEQPSEPPVEPPTAPPTTPEPVPYETKGSDNGPAHGLNVLAPAPPTAEGPSPPKEPETPNVGSKRGLLYNDATLTQCFAGKGMSWAYNWAILPDGDLPEGIDFCPMLWGIRPKEDLEGWAKNIDKALALNPSAIMAFNEPDHKDQAYISPQAAADAYRKFIQPHGGRTKLVSPAVTNGPAEEGMGPVGWLKPFMDACHDCQIDAVACHWYDSALNFEYFKKHMEMCRDVGAPKGAKVWLTEFGASGSEQQIVDFLHKALPWMDEQDYIERYAYFKVDQGLMVAGQEPNAVGRAYAG